MLITETIQSLHWTIREKLVWCLQSIFIGYMGLVVIYKSGVYREDS
jgi:hypothetical protein